MHSSCVLIMDIMLLQSLSILNDAQSKNVDAMCTWVISAVCGMCRIACEEHAKLENSQTCTVSVCIHGGTIALKYFVALHCKCTHIN